jgi:GTP-binding protein Era
MSERMAERPFRAGMVAIVGRPNVGKSTLLNRLVGQKISITSRRPQTTRNLILGVVNTTDAQFVFVDTPGFQKRHGGALNKILNRNVTDAVEGIDVVALTIEAMKFGQEDRELLTMLPEGQPVVLIVNKIDRIKSKEDLLPFLKTVSMEHPFREIVPVSAASGDQLPRLLEAIRGHFAEGSALYGPDMLTDRSERFLAAELIREKLFRQLGEELPYGMTVCIEKFEEEAAMRRIHALILVDRESHKSMVIGKKGEKLKTIATQARLEMERLFGGKVFLEVWVKVVSGWAEGADARRLLGDE